MTLCRRERRGQQLLHAEREALRAAGRLQLGEGVHPGTLEGGQEGLLAILPVSEERVRRNFVGDKITEFPMKIDTQKK